MLMRENDLVYQSTRDEKNRVTASQAILQGLATDGLFTPITYPQVELPLPSFKDASYQEVLVLFVFLDDFSEAAHENEPRLKVPSCHGRAHGSR